MLIEASPVDAKCTAVHCDCFRVFRRKPVRCGASDTQRGPAHWMQWHNGLIWLQKHAAP